MLRMYRLYLCLRNALLLVWLVACVPWPCSAQSTAQSETSATAVLRVPAAVRRAMKPGGISLEYLSLPTGSVGVRAWAHLYAVPPKGVSPEGARAGTPFTRASVKEGLLPRPCPFYLDLFTQAGKGLERRATVLFQQQVSPIEIRTLWREPGNKRGLVLLLNFQIGNSGAWHVLSLDERLQPLARQEFWFAYDTAEPDYRTDVLFDRTDARGLRKVGVFVSEGEKKQTFWHEWKGSAFVDPEARYFVVAAVHKTRRAAEAFVARQQLPEYEIVSTDDYEQLPPRAYAVVVKRLRDERQAEGYVESWNADRKRTPKYTLLQAF